MTTQTFSAARPVQRIRRSVWIASNVSRMSLIVMGSLLIVDIVHFATPVPRWFMIAFPSFWLAVCAFMIRQTVRYVRSGIETTRPIDLGKSQANDAFALSARHGLTIATLYCVLMIGRQLL